MRRPAGRGDLLDHVAVVECARQIVDDHRRALRGQADGLSAAEARSGTGDYGDASFESVTHRISSLS